MISQSHLENMYDEIHTIYNFSPLATYIDVQDPKNKPPFSGGLWVFKPDILC